MKLRALLTLICGLGLYSASYGSDFRVPTDVSTIQAGLDVAVNGDTVTVADGTYRWANNNELRFNGKSILLRSENGSENCILEPELGKRALILDGNEGPESIVRGFTIQLAQSSWGSVLIQNSSPTFQDCLFYRNYSYGYGGAVSIYESTPTFENCRFEENSAKDGGGAIYSKASTVSIKGCNLWRNSRWWPEGWSRNPTGHIIFADSGSAILVEYSELGCNSERNLPGIHAVHSEIEIVNGTLFSCKIQLSNSHLTMTKSISHFFDYYSVLSSNDSSSANVTCCLLFSPVTQGVESVQVLNLIESQNSFSNPLFCDPLSNEFSLMKGSPALAENNPCGIQLGSQPEGCQPEYRVINVKADGTGDVPTIQDAVDIAMHYDTVLLHDGIYLGEGNRDILFKGRRVAVTSVNGPEYTILDCQGDRRDFHIGFNFWYGEDTLSIIANITIKNGVAREAGGAVHTFFAGPKFENCRFIDNQAIYGARNEGGAVAVFLGFPVFDGCLFVRNSAYFGGAILLWSSSERVRITNCTFVNNTAQLRGSAISVGGEQTATRISNCIFAFNYDKVGTLYSSPQHPLNITCTNIFGNEAGDWTELIADQADQNGNLSLDPEFCDTTTGNYSLSEFSPCAPVNNSCGELIGALEVGCITTDMSDDYLNEIVPSAFSLGQNFPNPFNPSTIIQYNLSEPAEVDLSIFNLLGQQVRHLVSGFRPAGDYMAEWDGTSDDGNAVASGMYLYKLKTNNQTSTRKMLLLR